MQISATGSNLAEDIALADLAEIAGLSPHHFCRAFAQTIGMPPYAWLTAQRIERAKELVRSGNLPLKQIAQLSGFTSVQYMTYLFRHSTGQSPAQFRRSFQNR